MIETREELTKLPSLLRENLYKAYSDSMIVQDACNISGVVHAFSRHMTTVSDVCNALGKSTDWKNQHPVCIMFADKIASLSHTGRIMQAYEDTVKFLEEYKDLA